ncbi:hypothetical protein PHSY_007259 [Pseudozyma hubeiensis SY62]|uniref:Uncharacterized protein n=1 Tax=Pseudozyma hubeiensis (strain SY62) TaxID=1305764 RepID=R9PE69_PSEHS|nr:hypothetical protein PHSY_007259 [Pseudozyma hubeiensis SY62]GAC99656.1 hypothetical protein PHSY_007259 [Pseudozyma hubeiensis SY62]
MYVQGDPLHARKVLAEDQDKSFTVCRTPSAEVVCPATFDQEIAGKRRPPIFRGAVASCSCRLTEHRGPDCCTPRTSASIGLCSCLNPSIKLLEQASLAFRRRDARDDDLICSRILRLMCRGAACKVFRNVVSCTYLLDLLA